MTREVCSLPFLRRVQSSSVFRGLFLRSSRAVREVLSSLICLGKAGAGRGGGESSNCGIGSGLGCDSCDSSVAGCDVVIGCDWETADSLASLAGFDSGSRAGTCGADGEGPAGKDIGEGSGATL